LGDRRRVVRAARVDRHPPDHLRGAVRRLTLGVDRSARVTTLSAPMSRRIALLSTLLTLALVAPAAAQTNPFGPLPQAQPTETAAPGGTATSTDDNSPNPNP